MATMMLSLGALAKTGLAAASMSAAPAAAAAGATAGLGGLATGGAILGQSAAAAGAGLGLGSLVKAGGGALTAAGQIQQANTASNAAKYNAQILEQQANEKTAVAQREAEEERRLARLRMSRARAVGASSGGGQDYDLLGDLEEDGELRALAALYEGNTSAAGLKAQSNIQRLQARSSSRAGSIGTARTLLSTGSSFFGKYS